jgi:hypothetical protein
MNPEPGRTSDTPMTKTYVGVLILEVVIVVALWVFQRMFS